MLRPLRDVLVPELPHLRVGGRNGTQLVLPLQLLDEALLQNRPALVVGQPAAPFLFGDEACGAKLRLEVEGGGELLADVLDRLLHLALDLFSRPLHAVVAHGLSPQQLFVHHLIQELAPHGLLSRRVVRDLRPLRALQDELLFDLRPQNRYRADDGDDPVDRRRCALPLGGGRRRSSEEQCTEGGPGGRAHVSEPSGARSCRAEWGALRGRDAGRGPAASRPPRAAPWPDRRRPPRPRGRSTTARSLAARPRGTAAPARSVRSRSAPGPGRSPRAWRRAALARPPSRPNQRAFWGKSRAGARGSSGPSRARRGSPASRRPEVAPHAESTCARSSSRSATTLRN